MVLFGAGWRLRLWVPFLTAFAVPVLLRQVQTIGGVGLTIWATDLYYTAGSSRRVMIVLALPPPDQIEAWFQTNQIYRGTPNSGPVSEVLGLLVSSGQYLLWLNELGPSPG